MTNVQANNLANFEAATIHDGFQSEVVLRRTGGPVILGTLPAASRQAVATYTATAQAVIAGGASMPRDALTAGCSGGAPSREGRQAVALDQVRFLKKMESAVGTDPVMIGRRNPTPIKPLDLWRAVCLSEMAMERYLAKMGLKPAKSRMSDINACFTQSAERVARAIGQTRSPY